MQSFCLLRQFGLEPDSRDIASQRLSDSLDTIAPRGEATHKICYTASHAVRKLIPLYSPSNACPASSEEGPHSTAYTTPHGFKSEQKLKIKHTNKTPMKDSLTIRNLSHRLLLPPVCNVKEECDNVCGTILKVRMLIDSRHVTL